MCQITRRQASRTLRATTLVLGAIFITLLGGCKSPRFGNDMSAAQEQDLGRQTADLIDSQVTFTADGALNRRMNLLASPIFAQAQKERPDVSFRLRIIDSPLVNAFSLPGGYIYIYQGLLDKLGTDDDAIACVIAHESAHVVRRHAVKQLSDANGKAALIDLTIALTRSGAVADTGSVLYDIDQLHFSREDEYEADRWGEKFAYNAGYDCMGMVRTFRILENLEKKGGETPPYAEDHPLSRNRELRALEQLRELRANGGVYVSQAYEADGDRIAAKAHGIDYQALLLATKPIDLPAFPGDNGNAGTKQGAPLGTPAPKPDSIASPADQAGT